MATEEILMATVRSGGDRQDAHEKIREASVESAKKVKIEGKPNDLLDRLKSDPAFAKVDFSQVLDANKFTGRAAEQVETFLKSRIDPCRQRFSKMNKSSVELHI
jgi:adenylosuccinate lyase